MDTKYSIYLITGLMASGKSTISELLAEKMDRSVHLHGDIFRKMIISGRETMSNNLNEEATRQLNLRYRIAAQVAKEYYNAKFNVIVQDNYYGFSLNEMVEQLLPYIPKIVVLNPNLDKIKQREETRNKKGYNGFDMKALYDEFIRETPKIGYWLDTSELTPEETVKNILEYYK